VSAERLRQLGEFWLSKRPGRPHYYITWMDERTRQTKRKTTGTDDLVEAERKLAQHFQLNEQLDRERPTDVPLMALLDRYYSEHASKLPSREAAKYAIAALREFCEEYSVADFRKRIQEQIATTLRERGLSEGYISRIFSVARAALRRAFDNEEIISVPPFIKLRRGEARERVLSKSEAAALFNSANSESQFFYLMLSFATGARPTAILELTHSQLDVERRRIRLNPAGRAQNKKRRPIVPMAEVLVPWIGATGDGHLINYGGKKYTKAGWDAIFKRLVVRSGVKGVSAYTVRHTVGTEMAERGVPWFEIKTFLGHSFKSDITGDYVHVRPEYLKAAIAAINAYFTEITPLINRPMTPIQTENKPKEKDLRAHCVPKSKSSTKSATRKADKKVTDASANLVTEKSV
jgi:integrase